MSADNSQPICAAENPNRSSNIPAQIGSTKYTAVPAPNKRQKSARDDAELMSAGALLSWPAT